MSGSILRIFERLRQRWFPPKCPVDPFDLRYGVDTSGLIAGRQLRSGHPHDAANCSYWGTASSLFDGALGRWQETLAETPYAIRDYTLIDIGCGKGRVLMLASNLPFRKILGVELSPALAKIAHQNLAKWQTLPHLCDDIAVLQADALEVPFPDSPILVYLFNPFNDHVTKLLLDRLILLCQSRSTPIDVVYTRPEHDGLFRQRPQIQLLWSGDIPFSEEDAAADYFHGKAQGCSIYRLGAGSSGPTSQMRNA
jgi:SAM-dependent methyltransferase